MFSSEGFSQMQMQSQVGVIFKILGYFCIILGIIVTTVGCFVKEEKIEYTDEKASENEDNPIKILKLRYAKGEITKEKYEKMKKDLE